MDSVRYFIDTIRFEAKGLSELCGGTRKGCVIAMLPILWDTQSGEAKEEGSYVALTGSDDINLQVKLRNIVIYLVDEHGSDVVVEIRCINHSAGGFIADERNREIGRAIEAIFTVLEDVQYVGFTCTKSREHVLLGDMEIDESMTYTQQVDVRNTARSFVTESRARLFIDRALEKTGAI